MRRRPSASSMKMPRVAAVYPRAARAGRRAPRCAVSCCPSLATLSDAQSRRERRLPVQVDRARARRVQHAARRERGAAGVRCPWAAAFDYNADGVRARPTLMLADQGGRGDGGGALPTAAARSADGGYVPAVHHAHLGPGRYAGARGRCTARSTVAALRRRRGGIVDGNERRCSRRLRRPRTASGDHRPPRRHAGFDGRTRARAGNLQMGSAGPVAIVPGSYVPSMREACAAAAAAGGIDNARVAIAATAERPSTPTERGTRVPPTFTSASERRRSPPPSTTRARRSCRRRWAAQRSCGSKAPSSASTEPPPSSAALARRRCVRRVAQSA